MQKPSVLTSNLALVFSASPSVDLPFLCKLLTVVPLIYSRLKKISTKQISDMNFNYFFTFRINDNIISSSSLNTFCFIVGILCRRFHVCTIPHFYNHIAIATIQGIQWCIVLKERKIYSVSITKLFLQLQSYLFLSHKHFV